MPKSKLSGLLQKVSEILLSSFSDSPISMPDLLSPSTFRTDPGSAAIPG